MIAGFRSNLELMRWPGFSACEIKKLAELPWKPGSLSDRPPEPVVFFLEGGCILENGIPRVAEDQLMGVLPLLKQHQRTYLSLSENKILFLPTIELAKFLMGSPAAMRAYLGFMQQRGYEPCVEVTKNSVFGFCGASSEKKCVSAAQQFTTAGYKPVIIELQQKAGGVFKVIGQTPTIPFTHTETGNHKVIQKDELNVINGSGLSELKFDSNDLRALIDYHAKDFDTFLLHFGPTLTEVVEECQCLLDSTSQNTEPEGFLLPPITYSTETLLKLKEQIFTTADWYSDCAGQETEFYRLLQQETKIRTHFYSGFSAITKVIANDSQNNFSEFTDYWRWNKLTPVYPNKSFFQIDKKFESLPRLDDPQGIHIAVSYQYRYNAQNAVIIDDHHRIPHSAKEIIFADGVNSIDQKPSASVLYTKEFATALAARWGFTLQKFHEYGSAKKLPNIIRPFYQ